MSLESYGEENLPELNGVKCIAWSHGNNDLGDLVWNPTNAQRIAQEIRRVKRTALMIDGFGPDFFIEFSEEDDRFNVMSWRIKPKSSLWPVFDAIDPENPVVLSDFSSAFAMDQWKNKGTKDGLLALAVLFGAAGWVTLGANRKVKKETGQNMTRREFIKLACGLIAVTPFALAGAKLAFEGKSALMTELINQGDPESVAVQIEQLLHGNPDFSDCFPRTAIATGKFGRIADEEYEGRGFALPERRLAVWGSSHVLPRVLNMARGLGDEELADMGERIYRRDFEYLQQQGIPPEEISHAMVPLSFAIQGSMIARIERDAEGVLLTPIRGPRGNFDIGDSVVHFEV